MVKSKPVYLLDASIYIFRAWFGLPDNIRDARGRPVNAVLGYWRLLVQQLAQLQPDFCAAAFDESLFSGFRHQLYPAYKSNRALPDEDLAYQLDLCRLLTAHLGISCHSSTVYEADDVLATLAGIVRSEGLAKSEARAESEGLAVAVISRDKDLAQIVTPGDCWRSWGWVTHLQRC